MDGLTIRLLTADDAAAYYELRLEALETEPRAFGASAGDHRARGVEGVVPRLESVDGGPFVVGAFLGEGLVGTVGFLRAAGGKTHHSGFVWGVYVSPGAQGRGVASAMFALLLDRIRGYEGLERVTLDCDAASARALGLYEKFGFRSFGLETNALKVGSEYVDLHHMALEL